MGFTIKTQGPKKCFGEVTLPTPEPQQKCKKWRRARDSNPIIRKYIGNKSKGRLILSTSTLSYQRSFRRDTRYHCANPSVMSIKFCLCCNIYSVNILVKNAETNIATFYEEP